MWGSESTCPAPGSYPDLPSPPRSSLPGWCGTAAICPVPGSRPALPPPSSTSPRSRCPDATPRRSCWHRSLEHRCCSTTKRCGYDGGGGGCGLTGQIMCRLPARGGGPLRVVTAGTAGILPCLSARAGAPSCTAGLLGLPHLPPGSLLYSRALLSCSSFPQPCMSPSSAVTIHVPYTMNRCPPHLPEWFPLCRLQDPSAPTYYLGYPSPQQPATYGPDSNSRQVQHGWGGGTGGTAGRAGQLEPLAFPYSQAYPAAMTRNQPGRIP